MFDIGWTELLIIGVVALIVIGPKELPGVLRTVGQMMTKVRRMASEFQGQFQEAMREAEVADIQKQINSMTEGLDPIDSLRKEVDAAIGDQPATPAASTTTSSTETLPPPETQAGTAAQPDTTVAPSPAVEAPVAPTAPATPEPDHAVADTAVKEAGGRAA
jgi:sec-independent protein translocase protein TatB